MSLYTGGSEKLRVSFFFKCVANFLNDRLQNIWKIGERRAISFDL